MTRRSSLSAGLDHRGEAHEAPRPSELPRDSAGLRRSRAKRPNRLFSRARTSRSCHGDRSVHGPHVRATGADVANRGRHSDIESVFARGLGRLRVNDSVEGDVALFAHDSEEREPGLSSGHARHGAETKHDSRLNSMHPDDRRRFLWPEGRGFGSSLPMNATDLHHAVITARTAIPRVCFVRTNRSPAGRSGVARRVGFAHPCAPRKDVQHGAPFLTVRPQHERTHSALEARKNRRVAVVAHSNGERRSGRGAGTSVEHDHPAREFQKVRHCVELVSGRISHVPSPRFPGSGAHAISDGLVGLCFRASFGVDSSLGLDRAWRRDLLGAASEPRDGHYSERRNTWPAAHCSPRDDLRSTFILTPSCSASGSTTGTWTRVRSITLRRTSTPRAASRPASGPPRTQTRIMPRDRRAAPASTQDDDSCGRFPRRSRCRASRRRRP